MIPGRDQVLVEELRKIVHAVERHDAHAASAAMKRHLLGVRKSTKELQKIAHRMGINKPIGQSEGGDEVRRDRYQTEDNGKQNNME